MYPRRSNTRVKGAFSEHTHTLPAPPTMNQAPSLTLTHTESSSHAQMYTMYKHTDPGFPSSLLADCPPRGGMG